MKTKFDEAAIMQALINASTRPQGEEKRVVTVDVKRYEHLLDDPSLTEAQKEEVLQAVWMIVLSFVDLGFNVHPVQQAKPDETNSNENGQAQILEDLQAKP